MMALQPRPPRPADEAREIKVRLPAEFHIKLHTLKVLRGQPLSETVQIALAQYFATAGFAAWAAPGASVAQKPAPQSP